MLRISLVIFSFLCSLTLMGEPRSDSLISTRISDPAQAAVFNQRYHLVLPCHDYRSAFDFMTPGMLDSTNRNERIYSYIFTDDVFGKTLDKITVKKTSRGNSVLSNIWLSPLGRSSKGYTYLDNNSIVSKNYQNNEEKRITIGNEINLNFDRHSIVNEGDSLYYYATAVYDRHKILFGMDTLIIDFDFYEWNAHANTTRFLFSASKIVPDSLLVPELFESDGIYGKTLDIYHWNRLEKTDNNKLLINFAFSGFMQIDLSNMHVDWVWNNKRSSFKDIRGIGDHSSPYYTHDINRVNSGPFKGCYSYFENGAKGDSLSPFKPARARIFRINPKDNSIEIVFEKIFDISSLALGSVDVMDNYVLVNLGMIVPIKDIMRISKTSGAEAAAKFVLAYHHPNVYLYDLKGNEISNYTFPFGFYSYASWIKKK